MRHGKKINHLSRTDKHRKAMLANMASSLIMHKRINTTVAKAKALRKYVEPLITKAKSDTTHSRRTVFRYLQDKTSVAELFRDVAVKIADRPGGYTRIIKTGTRLGDNAEMCFIELVDYNELYTQSDKEAGKKSTRRSRRGRKSSSKVAEGAESTKVKAESPVVKEEEAGAEEPKAAAEGAESAKTKAEGPAVAEGAENTGGSEEKAETEPAAEGGTQAEETKASANTGEAAGQKKEEKETETETETGQPKAETANPAAGETAEQGEPDKQKPAEDKKDEDEETKKDKE